MSTEPRNDPGKAQRGRRGRKGGMDVDRRFEAKTLTALAIGVLIIAFAVANNHRVEVDFLVTTAQTPLVIVIVVAMLLGFTLGVLVRRRTHRPSKQP
jgi:uncharacterized integral membrane protein